MGRRVLGHLAVLTAGYLVVSLVSKALWEQSGPLPGLWFANVFVVAYILRTGIGTLTGTAAILVAALLMNFDKPFSMMLVLAGSGTLGILIGVAGVRWWFPDTRNLADRAVDYFYTLLIAGLLAPAVAGAFFAVGTNLLAGWPIVPTFSRWWSSDAMAFSLFLPVMLLVSRDTLASLATPRMAGRMAIALLTCLAVIYFALREFEFPFVLIQVPLIFAALRARPFELAIACLMTGIILVELAVLGAAPHFTSANDYQIAVGIAVVLPFIAGLMVEESRRERRRAMERQQFYRRAMMDSEIGVSIVGLDGTIIRVNDALARMFGRRREDLEGIRFAEITYGPDLTVGNDIIQRVREERSESYTFEKRYTKPDGTPVWVRVSGSVVYDEETDEPLYMVSQVVDIDARKRSEAALAEAETRWNFALASAGQGMWDVDLRKGRTSYSATWTDMLGYEPGELDGEPDLWFTLVHPDDLERVKAADEETVRGSVEYFSSEFRMRRKDGSYIWILDRGRVLERDENGHLLRAIGTLTDISARKEAEQRLEQSAVALQAEKERLRVTLESIGDAVICTDGDGKITFINPVAAKLTGVPASEALGLPLGSVYHSVDEETGETLTPAGPSTATRVRNSNRAVLVRPDGSRCSIREVVSPIGSETGASGGQVLVFQDFTDARALQRQLAHAANHDALTGLENRASFMAAASVLPREARPDGVRAHLAFIDLDRFKAVNDTSGHAAGDALLRKVAAAIRGVVRTRGKVARLGGDEFAVIFPESTTEEAQKLTQGVVAAIAGLEFDWNGVSHTIGASAGLASVDGGWMSIDDVLAAADHACYEAKAAGGGCVIARPPQAAPAMPRTAIGSR